MATQNKTNTPSGVPCLITTQHRGIYFGYVDSALLESLPTQLKVQNMRHCFKWVIPDSGVYGLATVGPQSGSKIGPTLRQAVISGVANVVVCEPAAVKAWESATWNT